MTVSVSYAGPSGRGMGPGQRGRGWGQAPWGGRGRKRGKQAFEGPQKIGKEGRTTGGPESERNTSYRPLGSALTIEEVRAYLALLEGCCFQLLSWLPLK